MGLNRWKVYVALPLFSGLASVQQVCNSKLLQTIPTIKFTKFKFIVLKKKYSLAKTLSKVFL